MNRGTYIYECDVQELFAHASSILFDSVHHTLGTKGLNTAIPTGNNFLSIINDGKTILESLSSDDIALKLAMNTLKESSFATNLHAGDGTTSTVIIQHKLLTGIRDYNLAHPDNPITSDMVYEMRDYILNDLPNYRKEIESDEDLKKVIEVSLGSKDLVDLVFNAFKDLPKGQKPTLLKNNNVKETSLVSIDGINLSPVEINPVVLSQMPQTSQVPCNVLLLNQSISRLDKQFINILNTIQSKDNPTVLIYTEIMPSVLDQLLFNIQESQLNLVPVRLAVPLNKVEETFNDLSKYFKCKVFNDTFPYQTNYISNEVFGTCDGYIMNKESIVLKTDSIEEYTTLPNKSSVIQVGFITYSQQEETYRRLEDAINSAYNAIQSGYVIGAGYTYTCLSVNKHSDEPYYYPFDQALCYITRVVQKSMNYKDYKEFVDYLMENVFDSYSVAEQVILNSFTVVGQILSTKCLLVPYEKH